MRYEKAKTAILAAAILALGASLADAGRVMGGFHGGGRVMAGMHSFAFRGHPGGFGNFHPHFVRHPHFMSHHPRFAQQARFAQHPLFVNQQPRFAHQPHFIAQQPRFVLQPRFVQNAPVATRPVVLPHRVMQPRMATVMPMVMKRPVRAY